MKERQLDGEKGGEKCRTDTMNYLIGRAPDIESLLLWAERRSRQEDPKPIHRNEVDSQVTVNGVDPSVLDGHIWAYLNLNITHQTKEVFDNVPSMRGLEVWRRLIGELFPLTDLRQMELQSVVYGPARATSLQRMRPAVASWETSLRKNMTK